MTQATLPGVEAQIGASPRDSWCTPEWVWRIPLEAMGLTGYDLDPCSNEWSTVPAKHRICPPDDGLSPKEWTACSAGLVWMNPPCSDVAPWFDIASLFVEGTRDAPRLFTPTGEVSQ